MSAHSHTPLPRSTMGGARKRTRAPEWVQDVVFYAALLVLLVQGWALLPGRGGRANGAPPAPAPAAPAPAAEAAPAAAAGTASSLVPSSWNLGSSWGMGGAAGGCDPLRDAVAGFKPVHVFVGNTTYAPPENPWVKPGTNWTSQVSAQGARSGQEHALAS
jgi:hypothetical protein